MANQEVEKKELSKNVVKQYDVENTTMVDHLLSLRDRRSWLKKLWVNITVYYDVYIRDKWYDTKAYFKNLRRFNKILHKWRPWDYQYQVELFTFGIEQLADNLEKYGNEVEESRNKKIKAMRELVTLLKTDVEDEVYEKYITHEDHKKDYRVTEYADGSVGYEDISPEEKQKANKAEWDKYNEALEREKNKKYNRIFRIIRGQKKNEFHKLVEQEIAALPEEQKEDWNTKMRILDKVSDGTGIESWWD